MSEETEKVEAPRNRQESGSDYVTNYMQSVSRTLERLPWEQIDQCIEILHEARLCRANVFLCGNGGSAATASHFVNDLNKGANVPGVPRFRAVGLTDNVPLLTAWSNDLSYADAFVEPLRNLARPGDILVGISCSGNSANVLKAVRFAREIGVMTIGFTGSPGGELARLADLAIAAPNECTEQIEDVHMFLEHAIVSALRDRAQGELVPSLLLANGRGATPRTKGIDPALPKRGAILLDRDGVINDNRTDYVKSWEEIVLFPGTLQALRSLVHTPLPIIVITNQSAINRHLTSFETVESIHRRLMSLVSYHGGRIDAIAWCPHRPDEDCGCRKPKPGLLVYAADSLNLDLSRSYLVGDAESDIAAGMAVGCKTALVLTGRGTAQRFQVEEHWGERCRILSDIGAAARWILAESESIANAHE